MRIVLTLPQGEIRAKATSEFSRELVETRLSVLLDRVAHGTASVEELEEVEFLRRVMKKKNWE